MNFQEAYRRMTNFLDESRGWAVVEYGWLLALISLMVVGILMGLA